MLQTQAQPRPRQRPSTTHADRRFKGYKPESAKSIRMPGVTRSRALQRLRTIWRQVEEPTSDHGKFYQDVISLIGERQYSSKDIENFSVALIEFQHEPEFSSKAGIFLSALINSSQDTDFVIHTFQLEVEVNYLGLLNTKNITVNGNTANVGLKMEKGRIVVNGNGGSEVGEWMEDGVIIIHGDVGRALGMGMKGGCITVYGNAGKEVGGVDTHLLNMHGGEIHLHGKFGSVNENIAGGRIFHKGRLIAGSEN